MAFNLYATAFFWGIVSAISLPIGAILAFYWKISKKWNCALLAFGAGALLFALTIEIYGEALCSYEVNDVPMIMLAVGSIAGSIIFSVSNYFIENQGGFLRKLALRNNFLERAFQKRETLRQSQRYSTGQSPLRYSRRSVHSILASRGSLRGSNLKSPATGLAITTDHKKGIHGPPPPLASVSPGTPLLLPDSSDSSSSDDERTLPAHHPPSHHPHHLPPHLLIHERTPLSHQTIQEEAAAEGLGEEGEDIFTPKEEKALIEAEFRENKKDAQVGLAIWLGILIDSFPESLVIGLLAKDGISITFIAGVFLSNLPEALSSTVIMKRGGFSNLKILAMWLSVTLITGAGAALGVLFFQGEFNEAKEIAEKFVEGLAAGAMLVMIAETALPEAFRHAGNLVGLSTLFGFLAAYSIKLVEKFTEA